MRSMLILLNKFDYKELIINLRLIYIRFIISVEALMNISRLKASFDLFDPEEQGAVHPSELKNAIISLGVDHTKGTIYQRINDLQEKGELITFEIFVDLMSNFTPEDSARDIERIFRLYDHEEKGYIDQEDIQRVAEIVGEAMSSEEIRQLLQIAAENGKVCFEEFYNMMTSNNFIFS